jgi:shikimate kinase
MCAGKSTIAPLLAQRLGRKRVEIDEYRWEYYAEAGYDKDKARRIYKAEGNAGVLLYWKPFEAYAVERVIADFPESVIDFGAGHSVYEDETLFARIQQALAPIPAVILLLPSPSEAESIRVLNARLRDLLKREVGTVDPEVLAANERFVRHPSNRRLAKVTIYTQGKSPEQTADEIMRWLQRSK